MKTLKSIIIADDNQDILTIIEISLEDLKDVEIKYCHSGDELIKEALITPPNLLIVDVMMPNMDGVSTFNSLKTFPTLAKIPVIFLTAKVQPDEITSFLKLGVVDIIIKPFDPLTLSSRILDSWNRIQN